MWNTLIVKPPDDNVCGTIRMKSPSQELVLNSQTLKDSMHFGYMYTLSHRNKSKTTRDTRKECSFYNYARWCTEIGLKQLDI